MWSECSFHDYERACNEFGYNCESSPEFISFKLRQGAPLKFYAYRKKGKILGSVCTENGWLASDSKNSHRSLASLPIPSSSIYVPLSSAVESRVILPFRSRCIHHLQYNRFLNTSYNVFSKRQAAFAKDPAQDYSKKTVSTRERELRNFLKGGGTFINVSLLDGEHIFEIYETLFEARRQRSLKDRDVNRAFFREFQQHFKGHVMFLNEEPVAIQLLLSVSGVAGTFVDFINIGYRMNENAGALGTMIMWKNLTSLYQDARENNQTLYYSYGALSGEYKARWCHPVPLGRVIF